MRISPVCNGAILAVVWTFELDDTLTTASFASGLDTSLKSTAAMSAHASSMPYTYNVDLNPCLTSPLPPTATKHQCRQLASALPLPLQQVFVFVRDCFVRAQSAGPASQQILLRSIHFQDFRASLVTGLGAAMRKWYKCPNFTSEA